MLRVGAVRSTALGTPGLHRRWCAEGNEGALHSWQLAPPVWTSERLSPSCCLPLPVLHNRMVCVFPEETRQFPHRLVATSWNLADNPCGRVVGFSGKLEERRGLDAPELPHDGTLKQSVHSNTSAHHNRHSHHCHAIPRAFHPAVAAAPPATAAAGTNDNHRLLPLQVRQHLDVEPRLRDTNGKMLAVLLASPRYHTIATQQVGSCNCRNTTWQYKTGSTFGTQDAATAHAGAHQEGTERLGPPGGLLTRLPAVPVDAGPGGVGGAAAACGAGGDGCSRGLWRAPGRHQQQVGGSGCLRPGRGCAGR